jgi:hypothetical protein
MSGGDEDMLRIQNRQLEQENRRLRRNLRDEFAMAALPEAMRQTEVAGAAVILDEDVRAVAIIAYAVADAMLEARK